MSKNICITPALAALSANVNLADKHGHETIMQVRQYRWGTTSLRFGASKKRDYTNHPLSARELAARAAFKSAQVAALAVLNDDEQKMQALARFNAAKAKGLTSANTLRGFLVQENI